MLRSLQAGRGLAAFAVVAYHLSIYLGDPRYGGDAVFSLFTRYGRLGVDFFFVLSGFIILHAHMGDIGRPNRWPRYAYQRFTRLFPTYWLYTAAFLMLALTTVGKTMPFAADATWWASVLTLIRFNQEAAPLFVAWTLFNELAFYGLFSTLILDRRLGIACLATWALVCLLLFHHQGPIIGTAVDVYSSAYNFNFFLGMVAFWLSRRAISGGAVLGGGLAIVGAGLAANYAGLTVSPLVYAAGFALGVTGAVRLETTGALRVPRILTALGDASYSLYLVHVVIITVALRLLFRVGAEQVIGRQGVFISTLIIAVGGGCIAYRWIESPLLEACRRWSPFDRSQHAA